VAWDCKGAVRSESSGIHRPSANLGFSEPFPRLIHPKARGKRNAESSSFPSTWRTRKSEAKKAAVATPWCGQSQGADPDIGLNRTESIFYHGQYIDEPPHPHALDTKRPWWHLAVRLFSSI
jgi:hypothetical protein